MYHCEKFSYQAYCDDLTQLYISEIPWFKMNPSMHKILQHSAQYVSLLPPTITSGMLSEEAAESANKNIKAWQISRSRQTDPVLRNYDTFCRLMDRSDPLVASHYSCKKKWRPKNENFPKEVLSLCKTSDEILALHTASD